MDGKRRLLLLSSLTLALLACEDSIVGVPEPTVDATSAVEAVQTVASAHGGCFVPGASLISWWPGDGNFDDVHGSNPTVTSAGVTFGQGVRSEGFAS